MKPCLVGSFDRLLSVSGQSIATKLLPYYLSKYNWEAAYLQAGETNVSILPFLWPYFTNNNLNGQADTWHDVSALHC